MMVRDGVRTETCVIATDSTWKALKLKAGSNSVHFYRLADIPHDHLYSSYILDAETPDLDLWPLPLLASWGDVNDAGAISAYIVKLKGELCFEAVSTTKAIWSSRAVSRNELGSLVAQVVDPLSARRIMSVRCVGQDDREVFFVRMRNGNSYALPLDVLDEADETPVASFNLSEDGDFFEVTQTSGNRFEIPWDDVLYHCEPSYEYFRGGERAQENLNTAERSARIGNRIRDLRMAKGLSVTDLADTADMLRPNLSRVERGKHVPSLETLERIADALGVPVVRLLTD